MGQAFFYSIVTCICIFATSLFAGDGPEKRNGGFFDLERWTFQVGAAVITSNDLNDFTHGKFNRAKGAAGGEVYHFSASYNLCDFDWTLWGKRFRPQLELPMVLGVVNERDRSTFFNYSAALTIRWKDFPFNRLVYTNIESGLGLSYTDHVLAAEREEHPDRHRSHLKFYWPIELMLAHPKWKQHQLVLFLHHYSGGHVFDVGGSNLIGAGYRHVFRER